LERPGGGMTEGARAWHRVVRVANRVVRVAMSVPASAREQVLGIPPLRRWSQAELLLAGLLLLCVEELVLVLSCPRARGAQRLQQAAAQRRQRVLHPQLRAGVDSP